MENIPKKTNRIFRTFVRERLIVYVIKQTHFYLPEIYILFNEKYEIFVFFKRKFENFKEKGLNLYKISLSKINKGFWSVLFKQLPDHDVVEQHRRGQVQEP